LTFVQSLLPTAMQPDHQLPCVPEHKTSHGFDRRALLRRAGAGATLAGLAAGPLAGRASASGGDGADGLGPLLPPDANGLALPPGFTSRVVAVSNQTVPGTNYVWHRDPDGGATFATDDGGWIYVSNAERGAGLGGVGALRFDAAGNVVDAYRILSGTTRNCAGGPTPWGTWISCEETGNGRAWECDPYTPNSQGIVRPAMGVFQMEAAAVDPVDQVIYLTEDRSDGLLYRFRPSNYPDLSSGTLEAAQILGAGAIQVGEVRSMTWHPVPDPTVSLGTATRFQVPLATRFNGGEGAWYEGGTVHITTKGNNRVWRIDTVNQTIEIIYQLAGSPTPVLSGVDNVYVTPRGDVYVAEDGGNLEIVAITKSGIAKPIMRLVGVSGSEITGPALSPDLTRLYFSSQRNPGVTFEVMGPFLGEAPVRPVPAMGHLAAALTSAAVVGFGALALRRSQRAEAPPVLPASASSARSGMRRVFWIPASF